MLRPTRLLVAIALAVCLGCPPTATSTDTAADEQAIRGRIDSWKSALASQNDSSIVALYADDAILMPPGLPRITERQKIRAFWARIWPLKATLTLEVASLRVSGDLAVEEENWNWTMPGPQGEVKDHGKSIIVWRRAGNSWQVVQDIWNSDVTPPAPAAN